MGEAPTGERLAIGEIEAHQAPSWVRIADPQVAGGPRLLGGRVVSTSMGSDGLYQKATELGLGRIASRHLGPHPEPMANNVGLFH